MSMVLLLSLLVSAAPPPVGSLSGTVTDSAGAPLAGVQVVIIEAHRNTVTNESGRYSFVSLPEGNVVVTFHQIGFRPLTRRVVIRGASTLSVRMTPVRIELQALQVTATADASGAAQSPQPVAIMSGEDLRTVPQASLGAVLENQPGVRSISTGQGVGKPVIRGLSSNRVLVLEDGARLENAQWGDEHGPQVETLDADRIEVIRGPASVLYGSDAIGGVVNVVPRELPDALGRDPFVAGRALLSYGSGATARDGGVMLEGAAGGFAARGSLVGRRADDVTTPGGPLFNSGIEVVNVAGTLGWRGAWGHVALDGVHRAERLEVHEDPVTDPGATPHQRVGDDRVRLDAGIPMGRNRLELKAGWERNLRREYEAAADPAVALRLTTRTVTGEAHFHHAEAGGWNGIVGVSLLHSAVGIGGNETLVPASRTADIGLLAYEQRDLGAVHLSAGLRFDARRLDVDSNAALGVASQRRTWNAVAGNAGVLVPLAGSLALVANLGRAWRAPSSFELFANGVHEGSVRFEVGDPGLRLESSMNLDAALRWQSANLSGEAGVFVNRIADYIYAEPTGATDPGSGFQIFQHTQGDAVLTGIETAMHVHPLTWLELEANADVTRGQNTSIDRPLPHIPPLRGSLTARLERRRPGALRRLYASATGTATAKLPESRRDPDDAATPPYELLSIGAGLQALLGAQLVSVDVGVHNVFDTTYRDFLSRYKTYADEMGRNLTVRVSAEF